MCTLAQFLMSYLYCQKPVLEGKSETVIAQSVKNNAVAGESR
jgi:hypothetical protein